MICDTLDRYVNIGGRRSRLYLADDRYINVLLVKVSICMIQTNLKEVKNQNSTIQILIMLWKLKYWSFYTQGSSEVTNVYLATFVQF